MNRTCVTTKEAAQILGLSPATLEVWRCHGGGPVFVKMGRAVRYRYTDLEAFQDDRIRKSTSDTGSK